MPEAYQFGSFQLDPGEHRLLHRGQPVPLTPKAFDLLVDLVQHAGRLREKRQLMDSLWPDACVEETNLAWTVSALRRALGDERAHPHFIETVATKGYRFVAPVVALDAPSGHYSPNLQHLAPDRGPYPGLRSFTEQDAPVFFGREEETAALWSRIRARSLLAVIGPSGAGKTSFLRAGVITSRPDGWTAVLCTPGTAPLRALGQAIAPELKTDDDALRQLVSFDDPDVAFALLRRWRRAHSEALVVIDQFEELFTNNPPAVQARVAALIGHLATDADIHVIVSLRDDFLMRCHDHAALAGVFSEVTPLGALTSANLRRAVVEPARLLGYRFEDEALVDAMIDCLKDTRGALPLLAFAMARLWELRDREQKVLTRAAYEQVGGVAGALAQHADTTLDRIGSAQLEIVRELFRNLVTAQGTRAVTDREELLSAFPGRPEADAVLRQLVDARLLTSYEVKGHTGEPDHQRIEIVHESLLTAWPRLVRWQTQDEDAAQLRDQLKQAAHLWQEKGRTADLLWTGAAFQEYAFWRQGNPGSLTAIEEDFARAMAARARRRRQVQRAAVAAFIIVLSVVALAIGVSRQQAARARDAATAAALSAEASKLLAFAELRLAEDPTEAALLAGVSLEQADTPEARAFLMKALWAGPLAFEVVADQGVRIPMFSPDGRQLAAAGYLSVARVWMEDGHGPIVLPGLDSGARGTNVPKWASNDILITGLAEDLATRLQVWSLPKGERLRTIEFDRPGSWQVGPRRVLVQTPSGDAGRHREVRLRSWPLPDGEPLDLGHADLHALGATSTFFEPDGRALLYARNRDVYERALPVGTGADRVFDRLASPLRGYDADESHVVLEDEGGDTRIWHYGVGERPELRVVRKAGRPAHPDWSGRWWVGFAESDQGIRLSDLSARTEARPLELRRSGSWYGAVWTVHPSGEWIVASTARFTRLTFWPVRRPYARIVDGYSSIWRPLTFSPDGKWLATSWGDGSLRLWPLPDSGSSAARTISLPEKVLFHAIAFDPAGRYVFAVGWNGRAWLVPLDGSPPRRLAGYPEGVSLLSAAVSPSGRLVAAASGYGEGDRSLRVWDLQSGSTKRFELPPGAATGGYERGIDSMAFCDEANLFTNGDGGLRRWNLDTGTQELLVPSRPGLRAAGQFSRDGRLALAWEWDPARNRAERQHVRVYDTRTRTSSLLPDTLGESEQMIFPVLDPSGRVVATGSWNGIVRVGRLDRGEPHILAGHKGTVDRVAISPDLRWVATTGEDNTLRFWPMPDLSKPPLHTLPLDQLQAKLHSLTNLRAVRDPASSTGWTIEVGPFPGWKTVPTW